MLYFLTFLIGLFFGITIWHLAVKYYYVPNGYFDEQTNRNEIETNDDKALATDDKALATVGLSVLGICMAMTIVGLVFVPMVLYTIDKIWESNDRRRL